MRKTIISLRSVIMALTLFLAMTALSACSREEGVPDLEFNESETGFEIIMRDCNKSESRSIDLLQGEILMINSQELKGDYTLSISMDGGSQSFESSSVPENLEDAEIFVADLDGTYTVSIDAKGATGRIYVTREGDYRIETIDDFIDAEIDN